MAKSRSPNWAKWQHIPEVQLWQAVALSLDIDPDSADRTYSWKAEAVLIGESKEFKDRLDVLIANFNRHPLLQPTKISLYDPEESSLLLSAFGVWALSLGWSVPSAFVTIGAAAPHPQPPEKQDLSSWSTAELWTLLEAAYLLSGAAPPTAIKGALQGFATPASDEDIQLRDLAGPSERYYRELKDATDLQRLDFLPPRTGSIGNRRVEPAKCIAWAMLRNIQVPECFLELQSRKAVEPLTLHPKVKESLLTLVITMAVRGYGYDPRAARNGATGKISSDATACGLSIDSDTVRKYLEEGAELISAADLQRVLDPANKKRR